MPDRQEGLAIEYRGDPLRTDLITSAEVRDAVDALIYGVSTIDTIAPTNNTISLAEGFSLEIKEKFSSLQCVVECWECIHRSRIDNQNEYYWCSLCGMEVCRRGFCYRGVKEGQR